MAVSRGWPVGLVRAVHVGTEYLHVVVGLNQGPLVDLEGSSYERSSDGGRTWGEWLELFGTMPLVAADGRHVYVAYLDYDCGGIGVRRNDADGEKAAWSPVACLSRSRVVDGPAPTAMSAGDGVVYVGGRKGGDFGIWSSRDHGRSWTWTVLDRWYWEGSAEIAASGRFAAVAWRMRGADNWVRTSSDAGLHWSRAQRLGPAHGWVASAAGSGGRLAFFEVSTSGFWVMLWKPDQGWLQVAPPEASPNGEMIASPALALRSDAGIGLLYSTCDGATSGVRETRWLTSSDDGGTWDEIDRVSGCFRESRLLWTPDGRVLVLRAKGGTALSVGP